jgi:enamine deaminase RidA (YjgF/YER057c/UK114 family)
VHERTGIVSRGKGVTGHKIQKGRAEDRFPNLPFGHHKEQTAQCLGHIKAIVESIGHVMDDIVKVNIQVANIADLAEVDAVYTRYFPSYLPARTIIGVSELPAGALIQMDAVLSNAESTPPQV